MLKEKCLILKEKLNAKTVAVGTVAGTALLSTVPCFAAETATGFTVTGEMVSPIFTSITTSVTNMLPLGLGVMSVMIGISLIPRIIYKFL